MGAINTDNPEIKRLLRKIKSNGRMCECEVCRRSEGLCPNLGVGEEDFDPRFTHDMIGFNFKTMEFQAALGLVNLKKADEILRKRAENVKYLNEKLEKFSDILQLPKYSDSVSYLAYPIVIKQQNRISRKTLRAELEKRNVETRPLFGCIPTQQPAYSYLKEEYFGKLPNAEYLGLNAFYVGCHQFLTREQLDYIVKSFEEILAGV
jgi:dTDP-4-amino-4,6-dideoxygalactose transaminase